MVSYSKFSLSTFCWPQEGWNCESILMQLPNPLAHNIWPSGIDMKDVHGSNSPVITKVWSILNVLLRKTFLCFMKLYKGGKGRVAGWVVI